MLYWQFAGCTVLKKAEIMGGAGGTAAPAPLQCRRVLVRAVQGPLQGAGGSLAGRLVSQAAAAALASRPGCPTAACRARGGQGRARGCAGEGGQHGVCWKAV